MTKHVVSLELAKRLKEAGYPQETEQFWREFEGEIYVQNGAMDNWAICAAPLATELLEQLPITTKITVKLSINSGSRGYIVQYDKFEIGNYSLPDALAEMYLYLNENNLL